ALEVAQRACAAAAQGEGVVITTGTDTLEELAVLCAMLHDGEAPIVLTGANRPGSSPGADGPANLLDAVAAAGAAPTDSAGGLLARASGGHGAAAGDRYLPTRPTVDAVRHLRLRGGGARHPREWSSVCAFPLPARGPDRPALLSRRQARSRGHRPRPRAVGR